jgi:hypothetical protein
MAEEVSDPAPTRTVNSVSVTLPNSILFVGSTDQASGTVPISNGTTQQMAGTWRSDNTGRRSHDGVS